MGALRARCEALERELELSHRQLANLRQSANEHEDLETRTLELQMQLDELRERIESRTSFGAPSRSMAMFTAAMVMIVGGFMLHVIGAAHQRELASYHWQSMHQQAQLMETQRELESLRRSNGGVFDVRFAPPSNHGPFGATNRTGRVSLATENAPVENGARCTLEVVPTSEYDQFNCRAEVRCGGLMLYGGPNLGYMMCSFDNGRPGFAHDRWVTNNDGDPRFYFDAERNRALVSDGRSSSYSVEIALDR